jgi:hypothetical protein
MATTTPNYGWDVPTSTDYVKDGATAIETLGDDIDATLYTALGGAYPGLRLIKKQTVGTGVASVAVTNAFSATYQNYKVVYSGGVSATTADLRMGLGATVTGYYWGETYVSYSSGAVSGGSSGGTNTGWTVGKSSVDGGLVNVEVFNPFATLRTYYTSIVPWSQTNFGTVTGGGYLNNATSYTDFTISTGTTLTGGTIYVYGYGAS